jgi:hypothetical protein
MNKNNLLIFIYWYRHTLSTFEKKLHAGGGFLFERRLYLGKANDMSGGIVFVKLGLGDENLAGCIDFLWLYG